jgi:hypothetical protein
LAIVLRDMKQYGYPLVNTVGFNEGDIRRYIQNQEENDRLEDEEKSGDKAKPEAVKSPNGARRITG